MAQILRVRSKSRRRTRSFSPSTENCAPIEPDSPLFARCNSRSASPRHYDRPTRASILRDEAVRLRVERRNGHLLGMGSLTPPARSSTNQFSDAVVDVDSVEQRRAEIPSSHADKPDIKVLSARHTRRSVNDDGEMHHYTLEHADRLCNVYRLDLARQASPQQPALRKACRKRILTSQDQIAAACRPAQEENQKTADAYRCDAHGCQRSAQVEEKHLLEQRAAIVRQLQDMEVERARLLKERRGREIQMKRREVEKLRVGIAQQHQAMNLQCEQDVEDKRSRCAQKKERKYEDLLGRAQQLEYVRMLDKELMKKLQMEHERQLLDQMVQDARDRSPEPMEARCMNMKQKTEDLNEGKDLRACQQERPHSDSPMRSVRSGSMQNGASSSSKSPWRAWKSNVKPSQSSARNSTDRLISRRPRIMSLGNPRATSVGRAQAACEADSRHCNAERKEMTGKLINVGTATPTTASSAKPIHSEAPIRAASCAGAPVDMDIITNKTPSPKQRLVSPGLGLHYTCGADMDILRREAAGAGAPDDRDITNRTASPNQRLVSHGLGMRYTWGADMEILTKEAFGAGAPDDMDIITNRTASPRQRLVSHGFGMRYTWAADIDIFTKEAGSSKNRSVINANLAATPVQTARSSTITTRCPMSDLTTLGYLNNAASGAQAWANVASPAASSAAENYKLQFTPMNNHFIANMSPASSLRTNLSNLSPCGSVLLCCCSPSQSSAGSASYPVSASDRSRNVTYVAFEENLKSPR